VKWGLSLFALQNNEKTYSIKIMTEKQEYYLGMTLSYIIGLLLTLPFFAFILVVRVAITLFGVLWDAFLFTPRVVTHYQYKHYEKLAESALKKANLN
tara:strand:- start:107 stop:397 length:291 start_codon:yes stop_codon:yes gene_type:complete